MSDDNTKEAETEEEKAAVAKEAAFTKNLFRMHDIAMVGTMVIYHTATKDKLFSMINCLRHGLVSALLGEELPTFHKAEPKKGKSRKRKA